jgi:hypothetical protein
MVTGQTVALQATVGVLLVPEPMNPKLVLAPAFTAPL